MGKVTVKCVDGNGNPIDATITITALSPVPYSTGVIATSNTINGQVTIDYGWWPFRTMQVDAKSYFGEGIATFQCDFWGNPDTPTVTVKLSTETAIQQTTGAVASTLGSMFWGVAVVVILVSIVVLIFRRK